MPRLPIPGIRSPIIPPVVRPAGIPSVTPAEKPQTTVYVGKISTTVENDFILSLLQVSNYAVYFWFPCSLLGIIFFWIVGWIGSLSLLNFDFLTTFEALWAC